MKKDLISVFAAASLAFAAGGETVRTATQPWVRSYVATSDLAAISTNNAAFVQSVRDTPIAGADASDIAEIGEYGAYGTVGAAILALIAGLAALKRRMGAAETAIAGKAPSADLRYALVTAAVKTRYVIPDSWFPVTFEADGTSYTVPLADKDKLGLAQLSQGYGWFQTYTNGWYLTYTRGYDKIDVAFFFKDGFFGINASPSVSALRFNGAAPVVGETALDIVSTATLTDRACNAVTVAATLMLPAAVPDRARDLIVDVDNSAGADALGLELASDETAYLAGGEYYLVAVADGDDLADLLTVAAGARARLYFTETAQTATVTGGTSAVPVISLQRLTVTVGGAA